MQDSLEDFIRISRNCKEGPTQVKKEVLVSAQVKKDCDAKALQIFQFAIEGKMRSDALFRCLPYINSSHYQDIVEERALTKLCGYPLCSKHIPDMPKKQFFISTKNNKVYDITDRKNYCSNFCYRASIHVKGQIDTSPLWLRKHNEKAHFTLLNRTEKGLPGEVIDQGIIKPVLESSFMSVSTFAQMSLDEAEELELNAQEEEESKKQLKKPKKFQKNPMKTINENEEDQLETDFDSKSDSCVGNMKLVESCNNEEQKAKITVQKVKPVQSFVKSENDKNIESRIYKCFKEWLTLETYMFIYGEDKVKEKLDGEKLSDYFDSLKIADAQIEQQKRYVDICRKLHLKEIAEEKFDHAVVGNQVLNPIPDYHELKEKNQQVDLKVKAFYGGELHVQENPNFPTKKRESEIVNEDDGPPAVLPMVDVNSQNALRRKIFLNSLNKTIQTLFQSLRINPSSILPELQALVRTFKLKPDNIMFKPSVWNYVSIILLKVMCLKDANLQNILDDDMSKGQLNLWLSSLPHKNQLVDDILSIVSDVDSFVKDYIICK